jgi:hypothetical protein
MVGISRDGDRTMSVRLNQDLSESFKILVGCR